MRAFLQRAGFGAAVLVIALISAVSAAQAKQVPSPWTWTDYGLSLRDVSCASPGMCTAVGQRGVTLRNNAGPVNPLAWTRGFLTPPGELTGVTCDHAFCLAVSNTHNAAATFASRVYRSTDQGKTWSSSVALPPAGAIKTRSAAGLACDSATACYAVGPAGGIWRSRDQGRTWHALVLRAAAASYRRVACPAAATCVAVGGASAAVIESATVTPVPLPAKASGEIKGLACDRPARCTATDAGGQFMSLSIPDKKWGQVKLFPKAISVAALACPADNTCVGLGPVGVAVRTTALGSASGNWHTRPLNTDKLDAISCSHTDCVAVGKAGSWYASFNTGSQFRPVNEVGKSSAVQCTGAFKPTCVAGGMDNVGVSRSAGKLWSLPLNGTLGLNIKSVNCTGESECLLLGQDVTLFTTDLKNFAQRHAATTAPGGADELACVTKDICVGLSSGVVYTTLDGGVTGWSQNGFPGKPTGMACLPGRTNPAVCVAATTTTLGDFIMLGTMTQNGGQVSWNWTVTDADPSQKLAAVGCSSGGQCTAAGTSGVVLTSAGTNLMHWTEHILPSAQTPPANRPDLTSVACPADGVCLAGGKHGPDAIITSTNDNWVNFSMDKIEGIEGADPSVTAFGCESVDHCVAVGGTSLVGVRKP